jgi:pimeloyl-ACP methyl ester carboxylesterase
MRSMLCAVLCAALAAGSADAMDDKLRPEPVSPVVAAVPVVETKVTTPDGVDLYVRIAGAGDEVVIAPFALYHGSALDRLARGRRVVTYDPRGRGRSATVSADKISLDHLLIDLDTVRRSVNAEKVAIIGWSGAGMETFVYALRNPGRVTRLVQLAPVAARFDPYGARMIADRQSRTDTAAQRALQDAVGSGRFTDHPAAHCRALNAVTVPPLLADPARAGIIPDVCQWSNEHPAALEIYFGALFPTISGYDWRPALSSVSIPRLVIHPERDNIPREGNEEWVRGQAGARFMVIEESGHFPLYEKPEATLAAIARFLDGRWPARARALPD